MKMKQFGIILSVLLGSSLGLAPLANAKSLTIANSTKKPFTVVINHQCAAQFGVIKKNRDVTVTEEDLTRLCGLNSVDCKASIFKSQNCTGEEIGNFTFDPKSGLSNASNSFSSAKNYSITLSYALNTAILTEAV